MKPLNCIYTDFRALAYINYQFGVYLEIQKGVRQGCLVSPLVFTLHMDRLKAFLESHLLAHLLATEECKLRVARIFLPSLLFADDIVFLATKQLAAQCILDMLSDYCA